MGRPTLEERFHAGYIVADNGCWVWQKSRTIDGYGVIAANKKVKGAHRVAYQLYIGEITEGLVIDHLCRNPPCVNPDHLEMVTNRVNALRGVSPSIQVYLSGVCMRGHVLTEKNSRINPKTGLRTCLTCYNTRRNERRKQAKATIYKTCGPSRISVNRTILYL
jgi:hypothetical protein